MAVLLRSEFERDGIHLSAHDRKRVVKLQNDITRLSMQFQRVMYTARTFVEVPERHLRSLPHSIVSLCERNLLRPTKLRVPTDIHVVNTVLKWVGDPTVRRDMCIAGNTCATENLEVGCTTRHERLDTTHDGVAHALWYFSPGSRRFACETP